MEEVMVHVLDSAFASGGSIAQVLLASGDGAALLWLLGPIAGVAFYFSVFVRYRNTNKRHAYERETSTEVQDMRVHDQVIGNVTGVQRRAIEGENSSSPRARLGRGTTVTAVAPESQEPGEPAPPPAPPSE